MTKILLSLDTCEFGAPQKSLLTIAAKRGIQGVKIGLELLTAPTRTSHAPAIQCHKFCTNALNLPSLADYKIFGTRDTITKVMQNVIATGYGGVTISATKSTSTATLRIIGRLCADNKMVAFGVVVLTDMDDEYQILNKKSPRKAIEEGSLRLRDCGIQGIVLAVGDLLYLRERDKVRGLVTLVPGIRSKWATWARSSNHERVSTPSDAVKAKADWAVLGRQFTHAPNLQQAISRTKIEMDEAAA